jgi:hypothetical protein
MRITLDNQLQLSAEQLVELTFEPAAAKALSMLLLELSSDGVVSKEIFSDASERFQVAGKVISNELLKKRFDLGTSIFALKSETGIDLTSTPFLPREKIDHTLTEEQVAKMASAYLGKRKNAWPVKAAEVSLFWDTLPGRVEIVIERKDELHQAEQPQVSVGITSKDVESAVVGSWAGYFWQKLATALLGYEVILIGASDYYEAGLSGLRERFRKKTELGKKIYFDGKAFIDFNTFITALLVYSLRAITEPVVADRGGVRYTLAETAAARLNHFWQSLQMEEG